VGAWPVWECFEESSGGGQGGKYGNGRFTDLVALLQAASAAAELRETVAALESQVHSDEIATHGLNVTLSGNDKEIARLEALRGADEEEDGYAGGTREEAAA
jgi:hypothetical protein